MPLDRNKIGDVISTAHLRQQLVTVALEWEQHFGVAPSITCALSEYDAACLLGCSEADFSSCRTCMTAVSRGHDFMFNGERYQVKANRPSGKPGSPVTLVAKATNYDWDHLIWILYNERYEIQEAWLWCVNEYKLRFHEVKRISPKDIRAGHQLHKR